MLVVRERWVGDGDILLDIDPSSSDHSSTSFSSWLEVLNRGSLRAQSPLCAADILSPTDPTARTASGTWLYNCLTCFRCSSVHLHRCISWLMARSRVNMLQNLRDIFSFIFFEEFRFISMQLLSMIIFWYIAQLPLDYRSHTVMSTLVFIGCHFTAFIFVIYHFISIPI